MLLKFAYDGTKFYGFQRQSNLRTVEGDILNFLKKHGIADKIECASRTDRGVSALGNVIKIDTDLEPKALIGMMNGELRDIYFHSFSMEDFNPRFAKLRWYRYHLPKIYPVESLNEVARIFEGEHDFRYFTKDRGDAKLKIEKIVVREWDFFITIDFYAQYYRWNLIRRIVAAMQSYANGKVFDEGVFEEGKSFGLAPPEPLILMDVVYPFPFERIVTHARLKQRFFTRYASNLVYLYLSLSLPD